MESHCTAVAARELELKLDLDPGGVRQLIEHPLLCKGLSEAARTDSVYFDTKDGTLSEAGASFRVRRTSDGFVQTLKSNSLAAAGLFDRAEWEEPVPGPQPNFERLRQWAPALATEKVSSGMKPMFETRIQRRRCEIERDDARIELVIDEGEVVAGRQRQPLSEIELELVQGSPRALFGLARELNSQVPLRLGVLSKSERGARLAARREGRALKAEPVKLRQDMSAAEGFRTVAFACLRHFRANEPLVIAARDVDALHQSRVALRRLRSALSLFKPLLNPPDSIRFGAELRELAASLGDARNFDVLLRRRSEELATQVRRRLVEEREKAYDCAIAKLNAQKTGAMMIDLVEWIALDAAPDDELPGTKAVEPFAEEVLDRLWKKVRRHGRRLEELGDEERHELRIAGKKLRYACEFFASLYERKGIRSRRDAFLGDLEALQDRLGDLNDIATEAQIARDLAALGIILPKSKADRRSAKAQLSSAAGQEFGRLTSTGPFWR